MKPLIDDVIGLDKDLLDELDEVLKAHDYAGAFFILVKPSVAGVPGQNLVFASRNVDPEAVRCLRAFCQDALTVIARSTNDDYELAKRPDQVATDALLNSFDRGSRL